VARFKVWPGLFVKPVSVPWNAPRFNAELAAFVRGAQKVN
jgi:hypothetical protein